MPLRPAVSLSPQASRALMSPFLGCGLMRKPGTPAPQGPGRAGRVSGDQGVMRLPGGRGRRLARRQCGWFMVAVNSPQRPDSLDHLEPEPVGEAARVASSICSPQDTDEGMEGAWLPGPHGASRHRAACRSSELWLAARPQAPLGAELLTHPR